MPDSTVYPETLYVMDVRMKTSDKEEWDAKSNYSDLEDGDELAVYTLVSVSKVKHTKVVELVKVK